MSSSLTPMLSVLASEVSAVLALRTLPFVVWALLTRRVRVPEKLFALLSYGSLVLLANSIRGTFLDDLLTVAEGGVYMSVCALTLVWLVNRRRDTSLARGLTFLSCCLVFLVLPGLLFRTAAGIAVLFAGWELTFSAYSYAVERRAPGRTGTFAEGAFFLLVNPVLCFPERGHWAPDELAPRHGITRCATGALLVALAIGILKFSPLLVSGSEPMAAASIADYGSFVTKQSSSIIRTYFAQAGVAHVQLGLLSLMGYQAPDRYAKPWLASSPAEFWRRWNMYVGSWFRRYVFTPLSYKLARRRKLSPDTRMVVAVLLTFFATGFAHDAVLVLRTGRIGPGVLAFMVQAFFLLAFEVVARRSSARSRLGPLVGRVCFWHALMLMAWFLKPGQG